MDFSTFKITSKKVRINYVDFSTSEITSRKVRGKEFIVSVQNLQEINISQVLVFHITTPVSGRLNKSIQNLVEHLQWRFMAEILNFYDSLKMVF